MDDPLPQTVALILHFRNEEFTRKCLDSLISDGVNRALVVDNSEDAGVSWAKVSSHGARWSSGGLEVSAVRPESNLGFSAGVNYGLESVQRVYGNSCVLLINSDSALRAGSHAALRSAIQSEDPAIAAARMIGRDGSSISFAHYHPFFGLITSQQTPGAYKYLSACCMLLSPELVRRKLFDDDFFFYGEDIELGHRLRKAGVKQLIVSAAAVDHEGWGSSRNGSLFYEYHLARAHWLLAKKLSNSRFEYWSYLAGRIMTLPVRCVIRTIRLGSAAPLIGLSMATLDVVCGRRRSLTPPVTRNG